MRFYAYFNVVNSWVYPVDAEDVYEAAAVVYDRLHNDHEATISDSQYAGWALADSVILEDAWGNGVVEVTRDGVSKELELYDDEHL